jgi:glycosyltransferase involved in cell wall biosynthesis
MKVLFLAGHVYIKELPQFKKYNSGFGMMVTDIAKKLSNKNKVYLLTHVFTADQEYKELFIVSHKLKNLLSSISIEQILDGLKAFLNHKKIKYLFYHLDSQYAKSCIKKIKPDIVHIHGISHSTIGYVRICKELDIPFLVTLHGLNSLSNTTKANNNDRKLEKQFIKNINKDNIPVTVVSSGIKRRIIENYNVGKGDNITVIQNGTKIHDTNDYKINIRRKHNISKDKNIAICVGNISDRKNQIQIVKAYQKLSISLKKKLVILFIGDDSLNGALQSEIEKSSFSDNLICCGFIEKKHMPSYYRVAELNIVASHDEGFGLSMIEGFVYGVPTITFLDLDAVKDLYHKKAMFLVEKRKVKALALGIEKALLKDWDKCWIKKYSSIFSLEKISERYNNYYNDLLLKEKK